MMDTRVSAPQFMTIANALFPIPVVKATNKGSVRTATLQRETFVRAYNDTPDNRQNVGTAWGVYNAFSDYASHAAPLRSTARFEENRFARNMAGRNLEYAQQVIMQVASA
jgi:hypothetical protein